MKRSFFWVCTFLLAGAFCAHGQDGIKRRPDNDSLAKLVNQLVTSHTADSKGVLKQLDNDCTIALEQRNVQILRVIEADDFTFTTPEGTILNKTQDLETISSGDLVYESINLEDVGVHVFGNTGVVTGKANVKGRYKTFDITGAYRYTVTFVRLRGRWQAVASQMTRVGG